MSNFDSDGGSGGEGEDRGELAWNEFDWERYLRDQETAITRYLQFYEASRGQADRIDVVAEKMNWGQEPWGEEEESDGRSEEDFAEGDDVYTLHKNPIFIATKALYLGLKRSWAQLGSEAGVVPQGLAVALLASLHHGEDQAVQAINALDFGDYAMAVSLFKRALSGLNGSLALLSAESATLCPAVQAWHREALPVLFDLREIWLRVMAECRDELERPAEDED